MKAQIGCWFVSCFSFEIPSQWWRRDKVHVVVVFFSNFFFFLPLWFPTFSKKKYIKITKHSLASTSSWHLWVFPWLPWLLQLLSIGPSFLFLSSWVVLVCPSFVRFCLLVFPCGLSPKDEWNLCGSSASGTTTHSQGLFSHLSNTASQWANVLGSNQGVSWKRCEQKRMPRLQSFESDSWSLLCSCFCLEFWSSFSAL